MGMGESGKVGGGRRAVGVGGREWNGWGTCGDQGGGSRRPTYDPHLFNSDHQLGENQNRKLVTNQNIQNFGVGYTRVQRKMTCITPGTLLGLLHYEY